MSLGVVFLLADTPATPHKKAQSKSTPKKSATKNKSGKKLAAKTPTKTATKTATTWRSTQRTPTPQRHKEIQQALSAKGYLQRGSPTGVWDASSVEALK